MRQPLLKHWDLLGVGENPQLADEYDDVIVQINGESNGLPSQNKVLRLLKAFEQEFGLVAAKEERARAAEGIIDKLQAWIRG